jgi:hypothetical protein
MTSQRQRDKVRELAAELEVLSSYDARREAARHDYGAGRRWHELSRRRRELDSEVYVALAVDRTSPATSIFEYLDELDVAGDPDALLAAYERIGRPRLERLLRDAYGTPSWHRSVDTWRRLRASLAAAVERAHRLDPDWSPAAGYAHAAELAARCSS